VNALPDVRQLLRIAEQHEIPDPRAGDVLVRFQECASVNSGSSRRRSMTAAALAHCGFGRSSTAGHLLTFCAAVTSRVENGFCGSNHGISLRDDRCAED
jgi:hypothetical protein